MDFSKTLFRCSALGYLMTEPKSKADKDAGNLSASAKNHLTDIYVSNKYGRQTDIQNKYIQKGLLVEEDSITLYSRVTKKFYKKNETSIDNGFIKGTPDLYIGNSIKEAVHIIDIKSSFDIFTFFRNINGNLNDMYYWQVQGYMALSGAKSASVAYCLVDTPAVIINDEKRKLMWKMGCATEENPEFIEACRELDRLLTYEDIPLHERLIEFQVERNDDDINLIYKKVEKARLHLQQIETTLNPPAAAANHDTEAGAVIVEQA